MLQRQTSISYLIPTPIVWMKLMQESSQHSDIIETVLLKELQAIAIYERFNFKWVNKIVKTPLGYIQQIFVFWEAVTVATRTKHPFLINFLHGDCLLRHPALNKLLKWRRDDHR